MCFCGWGGDEGELPSAKVYHTVFHKTGYRDALDLTLLGRRLDEWQP